MRVDILFFLEFQNYSIREEYLCDDQVFFIFYQVFLLEIRKYAVFIVILVFINISRLADAIAVYNNRIYSNYSCKQATITFLFTNK